MDPHERLMTEHASLRQQAAGLQTAVTQGVNVLAEKLMSFQKTVQSHFHSEEFYYRILDNGKRLEDRGLVHQLRNDHAAIIFTLESLSIRLKKSGVTADWTNRFDNLMTVFLPHLDQEDQILFPLGKKVLSPEELKSIAEQMNAGE